MVLHLRLPYINQEINCLEWQIFVSVNVIPFHRTVGVRFSGIAQEDQDSSVMNKSMLHPIISFLLLHGSHVWSSELSGSCGGSPPLDKENPDGGLRSCQCRERTNCLRCQCEHSMGWGAASSQILRSTAHHWAWCWVGSDSCMETWSFCTHRDHLWQLSGQMLRWWQFSGSAFSHFQVEESLQPQPPWTHTFSSGQRRGVVVVPQAHVASTEKRAAYCKQGRFC